jgi:hypothetical protein
MSDFKTSKIGREGISPQMALLHLRWQQIRRELLQPTSFSSRHDIPQSASTAALKEEFAVA